MEVLTLVAVALILLPAMALAEGFPKDPGSALGDIYKAKDYEFDRVCVKETSGPNGSDRMKPGDKVTIADIKGPGIISHIWFTLSRERDYVLKDCVLRIYWDDEEEPSVECPIGEFFGLGHGKYYTIHSIPFETGNRRGYNCFLPMPFRKRAVITFENSPNHELRRLFYHINYKKVKSLPEDAYYFHAQYRQDKPTGGPEPYTVLEAEGKGHFVGLFYYNRLNSGGWWGDGGESIVVDGRAIDATGQEDYFGQGWAFGRGEQGLRFGSPYYESNEGKGVGAEHSLYRFHIEDPVPFKKTFKMTIRHGAYNERHDDYSSVAFWYQGEPHKSFPELPPAEKRYPSKPDLDDDDPGVHKDDIEK